MTEYGPRMSIPLPMPDTPADLPYEPAEHQRWWTDHWVTRGGQLKAWLTESDPTSRRWLFHHAGEAGYQSVIEVGPGLLIDHDLHWKSARTARGRVRYEVCDVTPQVVETARQKGIVAHHGPIEAIPVPDRSYDLVYCRHVWEHCPDFRPALTDMLRVAKRAVVATLFRWSADQPSEYAYGTYDGLPNVWHNTYNLTDITTTIRDAGWNAEVHATMSDAIVLATLRPMV